MVRFSAYYLCVFLTIYLHVLSFGYNVRNFHYAITNERKIQAGKITQTVTARSRLECSALCGSSVTCSSGSYDTTSHTCFLSTLTSAEMTNYTDIDSAWSSFSKVDISDWLLVFRAPAGIGGDLYISYVDGTNVTTSDSDCTNLTSTTCNINYRHPIVDLWNSATFEKVKVSMYKNQVEDAYIVFNGTGNTVTSWFAKEHILESSWVNATTDDYLYFSMKWIILGRRFYICLIQNGCPGDRMYIVAITQQLVVGPCGYDIQPTYPQFFYANTASPGYPDSGTGTDLADFMAIFVQ